MPRSDIFRNPEVLIEREVGRVAEKNGLISLELPLVGVASHAGIDLRREVPMRGVDSVSSDEKVLKLLRVSQALIKSLIPFLPLWFLVRPLPID